MFASIWLALGKMPSILQIMKNMEMNTMATRMLQKKSSFMIMQFRIMMHNLYIREKLTICFAMKAMLLFVMSISQKSIRYSLVLMSLLNSSQLMASH